MVFVPRGSVPVQLGFSWVGTGQSSGDNSAFRHLVLPPNEAALIRLAGCSVFSDGHSIRLLHLPPFDHCQDLPYPYLPRNVTVKGKQV